MTPDDAGLECVAVSVSTRMHLAEFGFDFGYPFAVCVRRRDGQYFTMACKTIADIALFVAEMNPRAVDIACAPGEDENALLAQITGRADDPGTTLLH